MKRNRLAQVELVITDIDLTLTKSKNNVFYQQFSSAVDRATAEYFGVSEIEGKLLADEYRSVYGGGEYLFFVGPLPHHMKKFGQRHILPSLLYDELCRLNPSQLIEVQPRVLSQIRTLRSLGVLVVGLTGAPRDLSLRILAECGLSEADFDDFVAYERLSGSPKHLLGFQAFNDIAIRHNVEPSRTLCLGDSLKLDVQPALEAGMQACLISQKPVKAGAMYLQRASASEILDALLAIKNRKEKV